VVVIPDGALAAVPFGALPVGTDRYLLEERQVIYLDRAGDLLQQPASGGRSGALLVGDVDYGDASVPAERCWPAVFADLPGTQTEA
ncbi:CHAT domain-containing protein, partial [Escherichia coli]|nr:CHAT domain-containing protein [Escherichia coli]